MIPRHLTDQMVRLAKRFPVVVVTGPRQSGKTTLVRHVFPHLPYVSLEELDTRDLASNDPRGFLSRYPNGAILDEIHRAPALPSYLQTLVDAHPRPGRFILTGSQNLLLIEAISQSLAGRAALLYLLPLSLAEVRGTRHAPGSLHDVLFRGLYPPLYGRRLRPLDWYPSYLQLYLERDVRFLKAVTDLSTFERFLKFCAARTAQLLNLSSLAADCGITHNTARAWLTVLEATFIVHTLPPHHRNFNKRLVKSPKLYFYDTGLACALLGIEQSRQLITHPLRGPLFETLLISECLKSRRNRGLPSNLYFWRDKTGHEIDCLVDRAGRLVPVEIMSGQTITGDAFRSLEYWLRLSRTRRGAFLVYGGERPQTRRRVTVVGWRALEPLYHALG